MGPGCPGTTACHPSRGSTVGRGVAPTYGLRASGCPPPPPRPFLPPPPAQTPFPGAWNLASLKPPPHRPNTKPQDPHFFPDDTSRHTPAPTLWRPLPVPTPPP